MSWYYAEGQEQKGPVDEAELKNLASQGVVTNETLVWKEGMANWTPYAGAMAGDGGAVATAGGGIVCAECGNQFTLDQVVRFGEAYVCAGCKPTFVQRMQEGGMVAGAMDYAGFWIRFGAKFVDGLILFVVNMAATMVSGMAARGGSQEEMMAAQLGIVAAQICINVFYTTFFVGKFGATPGKMACKLKVVRADGSKLTYGRAFGRAWAEFLSGIICYIGYLMAAFDKEEHKALHDRVCDTRVIRAN